MTFIYTQAQLLSDTNRKIFGKLGMISSQEDFANEVVRNVHDDISLRSTRRRVALDPNLFPSVFQYAAPSDLRDYKIIDVPPQAKDTAGGFNMVPVEQFNNRPTVGDIAVDDYNGVRTLLINSELPVTQRGLSTLDDITSGGGTWTAVGGAENVARDGDDYIKGAGSVSFDLSAAAETTAGIENTGIDSFNITTFLGGDSSVFVWARINSPTDITNYTLKLGSDSSNYYSKAVTSRHDGNAFVAGWNLIRFDLTNLTETGTVVDTTISFASVYMTKDVGKVSETDYKFDHLVIMKGQRHNITYYSKYGWQSAAGAYKQQTDTSSDLLVADESEYELILKKAKHLGLDETNNDEQIIDRAARDYDLALQKYGLNNPDESQIMISTYSQQ